MYNRLDFLLPWYLDDYVELDRTQEQHLDELLAPFLAWHRTEELPRYLDLLSQIEQTIDEPLTSQDMEVIWQDFEQAYLRLEQDALNWLLALGDRLTQVQMLEFLDNLQEQQEEYTEEYLERDDSEFVDDTYDTMVDTMQEYLGRLNRDQKNMLRTAAGDMQRSDRAWMDERAQWLVELRNMLQREPGWQQDILVSVENRRENLPVEYVEVTEHNSSVLYALIAQVFNSRNEKQDKYLRSKMTDLKDDLRKLIAQAESAEETS
ncbi:MAG: hypothetical protein ACI9NT_000542 [Bacteroidia bacterium]